MQKRTLFLTQFSILLAIEAIFCFTPLGSIPMPFGMVATTAMIPVILTAVMLGTGAGTLMGFFAGLFSFIIWTFMPPPTSAAFAFLYTPFYSVGEVGGNFGSLLICFVPRILVGTVAGLVFGAMKNAGPKTDWLRYVLAGGLGSLANTVGVLGGVWLFFGQTVSAMIGQTMFSYFLALLATNGVPEMIVSALATLFICKPLKKALAKRT